MSQLRSGRWKSVAVTPSHLQNHVPFNSPGPGVPFNVNIPEPRHYDPAHLGALTLT